MIDILQIHNPADLDAAFAIRRQVFVDEQHVSAEEEYDEFEISSTHFLVRVDSVPCGTARWRCTTNGVKLERFAVLKAYRGRGVGKTLVQAILNDVFGQPPQRPVSRRSGTAEPTGQIYLHAQLTAMPLYAHFGFVPVGPLFDEAGIQHQEMVLPGRFAGAVDSPGRSDGSVDASGSVHPVQ